MNRSKFDRKIATTGLILTANHLSAAFEVDRMAPPRRQSTSKAPPQTTAPSAIPSPITRPAPPQPTSKLKIHPLLEAYETTISSLMGTLSEAPFRRESVDEHARKLIQCEKELEEALHEGT